MMKEAFRSVALGASLFLELDYSEAAYHYFAVVLPFLELDYSEVAYHYFAVVLPFLEHY